MSATVCKNKSDSSPAQDAIAFLRNDHHLLGSLFDLFDETQDRRQMKVIARLTCKLLAVHMALEEQLVYPTAHGKLTDDHVVHEAEVEHTVAKVLISEVEGFRVVDARFSAAFRVLGKYLRAHFKAEETEMLPNLAATHMDMKALGHQLAARRLDLSTGEGIAEGELLNSIFSKPRRQSLRANKRTRAVSLRHLVERLAAQRDRQH